MLIAIFAKRRRRRCPQAERMGGGAFAEGSGSSGASSSETCPNKHGSWKPGWPLGRGTTRLRGISILYPGSSVWMRSHCRLDFRSFAVCTLVFSYISLYCCMFDIAFCMLKSYSILFGHCNGARDKPNYHEPAMRSQLRAPPESHRKSSNFNPVSNAPKSAKLVPKPSKNIHK